MIEAEIKARLRDPARVRSLLGSRATGQASRYRDTYYDLPGSTLTRSGQELRVRVVETERGQRCVLTYKSAPVDEPTGSKPETQTEVADAGAIDGILTSLGFAHLVAFEKHCVNYAFTASGREILATVATVPELDGTFIEIETMTAEHADLSTALDGIRAVMSELGVTPDDFTTELYTDAVLRHRQDSA